MKANRYLLIFSLLLLVCLSTYGQSIRVLQTQNNEKGYQTESPAARVVFVSASPDLLIDENNGTPCEAREQQADGSYLYRFICDVTDTNKFKFNIGSSGITSKVSVTAFIEEGNDILYKVEVEDAPAKISKVEVDQNRLVYPVDNKAKTTIITTYPKLFVESATGETVEGPAYNEDTKQFSYSVIFDLSEQSARSVSRSLKLSVDNKEFVTQELGALSPKQAVDIAVIVIQQSCYQHNVSLAQNYFLNGAYKDAYDTYDKLLNTDECTDKPSDMAELQKDLKEMRRLANAYRLSNERYAVAEDFEKAGVLDSALHYHTEAYKFRNYILGKNPSDPYCLEYNRKYDHFRDGFPRIFSGKVVNNARMDLNGKNLPVGNVYIIASVHKRVTRKINGVAVPWYGDETSVLEREVLGQTDEDGMFKVLVKKNTRDEVYVLNFTVDKDAFSQKSHEFIYMPKDVDVEKNLLIKITPKGLNKYNK